MVACVQRIMSLREFSAETPFDYNWWLAAARRDDHPLPTIKRGSQLAVIDTDAMDWLREMYGNDGILRGSEDLDTRRRK